MQSMAADQAELKNDGPVGTGERVIEQSPQTGKDTSEGLARSQAETLFNTIRDLNAGFGEIVTLMLRDPYLRHLSLADLEWLVAPPLAVNQVLTLRGKVKDKDGLESGLTVPLAFALWAKVSKAVDEKLEAQKAAGAPLRLAPHEWVSGDTPWLVLLVGPDAMKSRLVEKMRTDLGADMKGVHIGTDSVSVDGEEAADAEAAEVTTEGRA
ncbi:toxin-activating lysine-acyltransferase [Roseibium sp. HPY-6]|uniref:toxin-activating lysine-acyltransferase n=1 Tax=Roseibium sp. HPY-6 TaxID=3229852 RepID=UPI00338F94BE